MFVAYFATPGNFQVGKGFKENFKKQEWAKTFVTHCVM